MAFVLKGRSAEIKLPVVAVFPDGDESFTAVFKRGGRKEAEEMRVYRDAWLKDGKQEVDLAIETLGKWLIRIEDLPDENGGKVSAESADILPLMLESEGYIVPLYRAAMQAISNIGIIDGARVGN